MKQFILHTFSIKKPLFSTNLQRKYIHRTYDIIAQHFNHTRFAVWPKVKNWIDMLEHGSIVYDIGCGNGKYFNNAKHFMLGCDISINLLQHALQRNNVPLVASDVLNLPIRTQSCDAFLCVAVLHHLSSQQTRLQALSELSRILRPKGRGLIYVWCLEQAIRNKQAIPQGQIGENHSSEQDVLVRWHLQQKFGQNLQKGQQFQRSSQKKAIILKRYYHLYAKDQLQSLIENISTLNVTSSYYDKQNWCCQVQKK